MKSRFVNLRISSHDRKHQRPGETNTHFEVDIPSSVEWGLRVVGCRVLHCTIPHGFDNVHQEDFHFAINGTDSTFNLPDNYYTIEDVFEFLEIFFGLQPTAANLKFTTLDVGGGKKVNIHNNGPSSFEIQNTFETEYPTIWTLLGFGQNNKFIASGDNQRAHNLPNFAYPSTVYVHSNLGPRSFDGDGARVSLLDTVTLGTFGSVNEYHQPQSMMTYYDTPRTISSVRLTLRDSQGRILQLDNNMDWTIVVQLEYHLP